MINDDAYLEILGETVIRPHNMEEDMEEARILILFQESLYIYLQSPNRLNMWSVVCACTCWRGWEMVHKSAIDYICDIN